MEKAYNISEENRRILSLRHLHMRTFAAFHQMLATNEELARKVQQLDRRVTMLYDDFQMFIAPPNPPKKHPIGYVPPEDD